MDSTYAVGVFAEQKADGTWHKFHAYTLWYNPQWPNCCRHILRAPSGREAKRQAIAHCKVHHRPGKKGEKPRG